MSVRPAERPAPGTAAPAGVCGDCGAALETAAVCFACGVPRRLGLEADAFALFGLEPAYALERAALDAMHERLTVALHPDFFAGGPAEVHQLAERLSARINAAYETLADPSRRAGLLLELWADPEALDTRELPPGFLEEMFMLQEQVDDLGEDAPDAERAPLRDQVQRRLDETLAERERLFAKAADDPAPERWQAIQSNLNQENYLRRLLERLAA